MVTMDFVVDELGLTDIEGVVSLHLTRFPFDFITGLGAGFLGRVFYPAYIRSPVGFGFVARRDGDFLGYIVGSEDYNRFYRWMLRSRPLSLLAGLLGGVLRRRAYARRVLAVFFTARRGPRPSVPADLGYVAVVNSAAGYGVGRALVSAMTGYLRLRGHEGCWVKGWADNPETDGFYRSVGFEAVKDFDSDGRRWRLYELSLNRADGE